MEKYVRNGIDILVEHSPKTPRISVNFFFKVAKKEKFFGTNALLTRLLLQGTKTRNAVEISNEFENECIDISFKNKQDFIKASLTFLNEDFNKAMELFKDLILNSTFDDFEKEVFKIKGEIISELDNPRTKLNDLFIRELFGNHPYSSTYTKILDDLDKISKEDVIEAHKIMLDSPKAIVYTGEYINLDGLLDYFENNFAFMKSNNITCEIEDIYSFKENKTVWISKNDASQAQIIEGCLVDSFSGKDCAKIALLNNILGSAGLSSRLFVNLRDKQGLAYTVRSQYETMLHSGIFSMYIGTAPKNIKKSLDGFKDELKKLADNPPDENELRGGKENISGRMKYFTQNNSQISAVTGYNYIMGLGLDYDKKFLEEINNVTSADISDMAKKILSLPKLTAIIAPDEYKVI